MLKSRSQPPVCISTDTLLAFFVARTARARQGVDVDKLAMEIPPE